LRPDGLCFDDPEEEDNAEGEQDQKKERYVRGIGIAKDKIKRKLATPYLQGIR
jgi:hypothetical protein